MLAVITSFAFPQNDSNESATCQAVVLSNARQDSVWASIVTNNLL
jgi:hypothetical protein